jgi:hypothetical protein
VPDHAHRRGDLTVDRRHYRRAYVVGNAFEFFIALSAVVAGVTFFVDPASLASSSVGQRTELLAFAWSALYTGGGLAIVAGMLRPAVRLELAGLSLLASAIAINAVAIFSIHAVAGVAAAATYMGLAFACGARAWLLVAMVHHR